MYGSVQEQEERDYQIGAFENEFQAAYAVSRATTPTCNDRAEIDRLLATGSHVIVYVGVVYCRFTDAILGEQVKMIAAFNDAEEAVQHMHDKGMSYDECDNEGYILRSPQPRHSATLIELEPEECPF